MYVAGPLMMIVKLHNRYLSKNSSFQISAQLPIGRDSSTRTLTSSGVGFKCLSYTSSLKS